MDEKQLSDEEFAVAMRLGDELCQNNLKLMDISYNALTGVLNVGGCEIDSDKTEQEMQALRGSLGAIVEVTKKNHSTPEPASNNTPIPASASQAISDAATTPASTPRTLTAERTSPQSTHPQQQGANTELDTKSASLATSTRPIKATFSVMVEKFIKHKINVSEWKSEKNATGMNNTANLFEKFFGNDYMHRYINEHAEDFLDNLRNIPASWLRQPDTRDLEYEDAIEIDKPKLTNNAVRDHIIRINALFNYARIKKYADYNIFEGVTVKKAIVNRTPFTPTEISYLITKPNFKAFQLRDSQTHYWPVLLAAYTGMRLGEIFFLTPDDVYKKHGMWIIDINRNGEKKVKNDESVRLLPLHNNLEQIGFTDFCEQRNRTHPGQPLFSEYPAYNGQAGYKFSGPMKDWIDSTIRRVPGEDQKYFQPYRGMHTFRHNFIFEMRQKGIDRSIQRRLTGHSEGKDAHDGLLR